MYYTCCYVARRHHSSTCAGIHINMCVTRPNLTNPMHLLQLINAFLLPSVPLLLTSSDIQRVQVRGRVGAGVDSIHNKQWAWTVYANARWVCIILPCKATLAHWLLARRPSVLRGGATCGGSSAQTLCPCVTPLPHGSCCRQDLKRFQSQEAGYQKIQGTKPQTLAYALQVRHSL